MSIIRCWQTNTVVDHDQVEQCGGRVSLAQPKAVGKTLTKQPEPRLPDYYGGGPSKDPPVDRSQRLSMLTRPPTRSRMHVKHSEGSYSKVNMWFLDNYSLDDESEKIVTGVGKHSAAAHNDSIPEISHSQEVECQQNDHPRDLMKNDGTDGIIPLLEPISHIGRMSYSASSKYFMINPEDCDTLPVGKVNIFVVLLRGRICLQTVLSNWKTCTTRL